MSTEQNRNSQTMAWTSAFIVLFYILSVGPAEYFSGGLFSILFKARYEPSFYTTLAWVAAHTPLGAPLEAYCNWWWQLRMLH
jgi:hypothetical protein